MSDVVKLSKADVRRAMARLHFAPCDDALEVLNRTKSVQFDPISPVGCNHDLALQSRYPEYQIGDWKKLAHVDKVIYEGLDKQASLIPFEGWPLRRYFHAVCRRLYDKKILTGCKGAVEAILKELEDRGPLMPKEFAFQQRNEAWKDTWNTGNVTTQVLRALWFCGFVMTVDRRKGQHVYDLTERVVPEHLQNEPLLPEAEACRELILERHRTIGLVKTTAPADVFSYQMMYYSRKQVIKDLLEDGEIIPVDVEGMKANASGDLMEMLDEAPHDPRVIFMAPLDTMMWDRKMIAHLFDFEYMWEVFVPEPKRRWGYYVLPVFFGDRFVAKVEFTCRNGVLEMKHFHCEPVAPGRLFWGELEIALQNFVHYCSATEVVVSADVDPKIRDMMHSLKLG